MFIDSNKDDVDKFIYLANYLKPNEIQINTPLRPCSINPLWSGEIFKIRDLFSSGCKGINMISVYDERTPRGVSS